MYSKREELEKFRKRNGPLIDVRSPGEYYKGNMPNSINIPLFDNEERSIVGTIYKKHGREKAVIQGLEFIAEKIETIVNKLFETINDYNSKNYISKLEEPTLKIYCARGGMRSQSISWLLEKYNQRSVILENGYKRYRKWILESFNQEWKIIVIGGKTGTGKTKLLKLLDKNNYQIIDLEGLACHRGSTFGGLGMREQPSNEQFENKIAEELKGFKKNNKIFVEAESSNIGKCKIPHEFFNQMKTAERIEIKKSESNRLEELIQTYSIFQEKDLIEAVLRIKKRLGPQRTKNAIESIKIKDWKSVCKSVLEYYDKCYEYEKTGKNNIKVIDMTDIFDDQKTLRLIKEFMKF
ncbi:Predicted ATPase [Prochlorococcus marinus str. MIT 9515]|uniref:Predicted ATPase n=1 Tax=Prochlorococcus marinus (strain MIT 9515) TaxID=167542 RepID=A2BWQ4_PROM5|nr:tRNA 2-selenouridine(34) synthase MnmH [Prochlorococcus marinus]ABM72215.1 Predicted ATPase [Prochlorococcus marinus str. MIT 9515]